MKISLTRFGLLWFILFISLVSLIFGQSREIEVRDTVLFKLKSLLNLSDDNVIIRTMDDATAYAEKGDTILFSILLDLVPRTDGYVSEGLGYNLASLFLNQPEFFLNQVSKRLSNDQKYIATMTFFADGGGMRDEEYVRADSILIKLSGSSNIQIRLTAHLFIPVLKHVREQLKN